MTIEIKHKDGRILKSFDELDGAFTMQAAHLDLRGSYLAGADLSAVGAPEWWTWMYEYCGFRTLQDCDLTDASFVGANLSRMMFGNARLYNADLTGCKINFGDHSLVAELLRQHAGNDPARLAGAEMISSSRDLCWVNFMAMGLPDTAWAMDVFRSLIGADEWDENISVRPGSEARPHLDRHRPAA